MVHVCKRPGCEKARPGGTGYCSNACYVEDKGPERKAAKEAAEVARKSDKKQELADRLFPHIEDEVERVWLLDDLVEYVKDPS